MMGFWSSLVTIGFALDRNGNVLSKEDSEKLLRSTGWEAHEPQCPAGTDQQFWDRLPVAPDLAVQLQPGDLFCMTFDPTVMLLKRLGSPDICITNTNGKGRYFTVLPIFTV